MTTIFPSHLNDDITKYVYAQASMAVDTAVENSELYCCNPEGDRNSVVSQTSYRIDVTRLEQRSYIKIAILQEKNVRECHSELLEVLGNNDKSFNRF